MPPSNFAKYALFNIVPSKQPSSLNLFEYILLLSITLIWILVIFYFYDRLMSFLWRIIIIKHFWLKPSISFSFASIRFNLFSQAIYIRDLHVRLGGEEWFKCTSLEVKLNRLKPRLFTHMITKKMFYLRFHECKALLRNFDTKLFDLVELLSLRSCLFDITDLSILVYNARTLQAFDFGRYYYTQFLFIPNITIHFLKSLIELYLCLPNKMIKISKQCNSIWMIIFFNCS